ncbi:MAG: HAMP domain-containing histidine kinase [Labilithrix sp.]|nr:HAMP domain-containing histidine kinase [Labilithrix sp.]MCW5816367.1 HAMP domain-containing histidine kinase [Labilithrix sp.]
MKRPLVAWVTFVLALAIPNALLGAAGLFASKADVIRQQSAAFQRRVDTAGSLRQDIELAMLRSAEVLRALPTDAAPEMVLAAIAAASNPFAVGFVAHEGVVSVPTPSDGTSPAADPTTRDGSLAKLMSDQLVLTMVRAPFLTINGQEVRYIHTKSLILTTRDLRKGLRVGWLLDASTLTRGAANVIPAELTLVSAPRAPATSGEDPLLNEDRPWPPANDSDAKRVVRFSNMPTKPAVVATPEDATLVFVGKGELVFHVVMRDPASFDRELTLRRVKVGGVVAGSLFLIDALAVFLFLRARKAQRLADLRTDFVAAVSHELRTPLASVRMFAELLETGAVPEDERAEVEQALAGETRRLHATLDRMLRFGALARGKLVLAKSKQLVAPILETAAKKRAVTIEVDPALEADVDGELLALAIDNLLSNAEKYAPADDDEPHVLRARKEGSAVVIDVIDNGPGLSAKAREKVFLPFERADQRLSRATEGSGVGLALVRGIARAHGGDATVASALGSGATFTLRLPCS